MKSRAASSLRFLLVIAICCSAIEIAHANNTIPWLTGTFSMDSGFPHFGYLGTDVQFGNGQVGTFAYSGDVTWVTSVTCDDMSCLILGSGKFNSGTVDIGVDNYVFSGWITSGTATASGDVPAEIGEACVSDPLGCMNADAEEVVFVGRWNNGWWTKGVSSAMFSLGGAYQQGSIYMTTYTPEPSSVMLFSSGILGLGAVLRRKINL